MTTQVAGSSIVGGILVFMVLGGSTMAAACQKDGVISYENSARTVAERFANKEMIGAEIWPKRSLSFQADNVLFGEELGHIVRDCSTTQYRCVSVWSRVFAVSRDRLSPAARYSVAGALLKVEDCLRGDASVCQVALISADCQKISTESCEEVTGGREKSSEPGPIVYFIYNEDVGVSAYGVTEKPAMTKDERLNIASQMILQGQRGLLFGSR